MITDRFDKGAEAAPERLFVTGGGVAFTYGQAHAMSHAIAAGLRAAGLAGGHVGMLAPNDPLALVALIGVIRAGATYVPLAATDADPALAGFMETADVEVLICHDRLSGRLPALRAAFPRLRAVVGFSAPAEAGGPCLADWLAAHDGARVSPRAAPDDVALIKASGGTTGRPKAILQTHRALETAYRTLNRYAAPETQDPVHLVVAPLTHAAGASTLAFAEFAMTNVLAGGRDPASILAQMEEARVSHIFLPPTVIYRLLAQPQAATRDLSALECIVYGAAPMSADKLAEGLRLWGPVFLQAYGQSEAPGLVSVLSRRDHLIPAGADAAPLKSAGRPTGACEVALITHGSTQRLDRSRKPGGQPVDPRSPVGQFVQPFGLPSPIGFYAMQAALHQQRHGTGAEDLALFAMAAREWARLNDKIAPPPPLTPEEYLAAPMICAPLCKHDICRVQDGAGAVILTRLERARDMAAPAVEVLGLAEVFRHHMAPLTPGDWLESGHIARLTEQALGMAGLARDDLSLVEIYDAFTIGVLSGLEELGFAAPGEGAAFARAAGIGPGGDFPLNTSGGGLAFNHSGMFGMQLLIETIEQLQHRAGRRQVRAAQTALMLAGGIVNSAHHVMVLGRP